MYDAAAHVIQAAVAICSHMLAIRAVADFATSMRE